MSTRTGSNGESKLSNFFKGVRAEVKKVSWPNRSELINHTIVVLSICALMGLLIWVLDTGLRSILSLFLG